jgi:hypothetical protein
MHRGHTLGSPAVHDQCNIDDAVTSCTHRSRSGKSVLNKLSKPKETIVKRQKKPPLRLDVQYAELLLLREEVRKLASLELRRNGQRGRQPRRTIA